MLRALALAACLVACSSDEPDAKKVQVELTFDQLAQLRLQGIPGGSGNAPVDLSYGTTYTLTGSPATLSVWPREGGAAVTYRGPRIEAEYSHVAGLLTIQVFEGDGAKARDIAYFVEPIRWEGDY